MIDENALFSRYLPLVRSTLDRAAMYGVPPHVSPDDLEDAGRVGLTAAIRRFDPCAEAAFASYAVARIRGAVLDLIRQRSVRTLTHGNTPTELRPRSHRDTATRTRNGCFAVDVARAHDRGFGVATMGRETFLARFRAARICGRVMPHHSF